MYPAEFEYFAPATVAEALDLLTRYGDDAKILAGGQSLVPMMKLRIASPRYLIDVNRIPGLGGLRREGDRLVVGALCRHAEVLGSPLVAGHLPLMIDTAAQTADVQVRNRGTVGGSLAHADPAGDWPTALLALDAEITITGPNGARVVPITGFFVDAYTSQVAQDEMITSIAVPLPAAPAGGAYVKFEKRAGDFAVASVGVQLALDRRGRCRAAAVTLGALGPTPLRARAAEQALAGEAPSPAVAERAAALVRDAAQPFADTRGSVDYKRHLAGVLFRRALTVALDRAQGKTVEIPHL